MRHRDGVLIFPPPPMSKAKKHTVSSKGKSKTAARRRRGRKRASPRRRTRIAYTFSRLAFAVAVAALAYIVYLDITIRNRFEGQRWPIPAHVYTRPLELYQDLRLDRERFIEELQELGYRRVQDARRQGSYTVAGDGLTVVARPYVFWDGPRPELPFEIQFRNGQVARLTRDGAPIDLVRLEPRLFGSVSSMDHEDRTLVRLDSVPQALIDALLTVEDRDFYAHIGVDPRGLARALWVNLGAGRVVQGGSTLTQQLVKNFYLTAERTLTRKLNEMVMAVLLEIHYDKDEILEAYLNEVYLGQVGGRAIHGFGLGSLFYFGRPLEELKLSEIALLVSLVRGPSLYNPHRHSGRSRERRNLVLDKMRELEFIDDQTAKRSKSEPLGVSSEGIQSALAYPAYLGFVRKQLRRDYREQDLRSDGLRIFTTLDPDVQQVTENAVRQRLAALERARKLPARTLEAAVVVVRSDSGEVAAMVGARKPRFAGFNRALDAQRPVGSLIKPVVYLAALRQPRRYTLATVLEDAPLRVEQAGSPVWTPRNYDQRFHGRVLLVQSLAQSYNASTARLGMEVGVDNIIAELRELGISRPLQRFPSLLLGAVELTPVEVAQMYLTFASGGFRTPLRSIRSVLSQDQRPLARYPLSVEQVVPPGPMALLDYALQEVVRSGTARGLRGKLPRGTRVSGKTGTTDDYRDSWFAGYGGGYLTVVWVGRDDNEPVGLSGASGAMLVWADIMRRLDLYGDEFPLPADVELVAVDPASGRRADANCDNAIELPFIAGSAPTQRASCASPDVGDNSGGDSGGKLRSWFKRLFQR